jgi:RecA-family ATPase
MSVSPKQKQSDEQHSRQDDPPGFDKPREGETTEDFFERIQPDGKPFSDLHLRKLGYSLKRTYNYLGLGAKPGDFFILYQSLRYEHDYVPGEKQFIQRRPGTEDEYCTNAEYVKNWVFGRGAVSVPYRWRDLINNPGALVFVCEGEGNADRVAALGLVATTVAGQKWSEPAAAALTGHPVVVLEDNDAKGVINAEASVEKLTPYAKSIRIVRLPGLPHGGDVVNWLDAGHTKEEFLAEVENAEPHGVNLFNVADLDGKEVPPQKWFLQDRIPSNTVSLISGQGAAGKSTLMLQLSASTVLASEFLGTVPATGPALFIDAEDNRDVIHRRLDAIRRHQHYNVSFKYLGEKGLYVASWAGDDAVLATTKAKSGKIITTARYHELLRLAREMRPQLIAIASSANVFAGNELDRSQVQQFIARLNAIALAADGTVILVSHPSLAGISSGTGLSGSTQWHNAVRSRFYMWGFSNGDKNEENGEPKGSLRKIEFMKNNYGPDSESIVVKYEYGLFVQVVGATVDEVARRLKAEEIYLKILELLTSQHQNLGLHNNTTNYAPKRIANHPDAKTLGFSLKEMEDAQQRLLDANKIRIEEVGFDSKKRQYIRPGGEAF